MSRTYTDLTHIKFGRLLVLYRVENVRTKSGRSMVVWHCKCDCGNEVDVRAQNLKDGNTKSCGCLNSDEVIKRNTTHGLYYTRLHRIWSGMKQRCYYSKCRSYKDYGGRGITICDEWLNDFKTFYDWAISNGYKEGLTIDRKNNDGNYEPQNCRWITNSEQQKNKRNNIKKD